MIDSSAEHKTSLRVLGWYHSHPRITVQPSHVDLRTQSGWQGMDGDFVGIIVAAFNRQGQIFLINQFYRKDHPVEIAENCPKLQSRGKG